MLYFLQTNLLKDSKTLLILFLFDIKANYFDEIQEKNHCLNFVNFLLDLREFQISESD
jgi:hypothetical protein